MPHRFVAFLLAMGVCLAFLISGSLARADTIVGTGLSNPEGVAVDGSGDVFIADGGNKRVVVDKPNAEGGYTQSVVDSNLSYTWAVAVGGSGDVFITDSGNARVVVDKPNGSGGYIQSAVDTHLDDPVGVAVDRSGDVFIANAGDDEVVEDRPNGSGGYTQSVVDTRLGDPVGVALDGSGDVFITELGNKRVVEDKPNGSGGYTQSVVDTGLNGPFGVAVDGSGDVFITDVVDQRVVVDKPNGLAGYTQSVVDIIDDPAAVAVDASDNVFIADQNGNKVVEHAAGTPAGAAFGSAESPGSLTVAFTDTSRAVSPATITGWSWNFGDGSPSSGAEDPTHAYAAAGNYTVSLTATDSDGKTTTISQEVVVAAVHASLTYPTAGQRNVNTTSRFSWTDIPGGQGYQLWIGTSPGDGSLLKSGLLPASASAYQVPALPTGVTLWASLYTEVAGSWGNWQVVPFTLTTSRDVFTYPTAGQQNIDTLTPFSWGTETGAQAYRLTIGTNPGAADLVNSGILAANITSYREPALTTGKTLYARLAWEINGSWSAYQDVSFTAAPNPVLFTHPTQGQTQVSSPTTLAWSTSPGATGYQLWVGTSRGSGSLLKSGLLKPSTSSYQLPSLPAGQTLWARIYTGVASGWGNWQDISFTTTVGGSALTRPTYLQLGSRSVSSRRSGSAPRRPVR